MNLVNIKYHTKRITNMLRYKGIRYTLNYLFTLAFYYTDFFRGIFVTKFYPWSLFYPRFIEIETTTRCNLRCAMCEHTYWNEKQRDMSFAEFKGIIGQFPNLKWVGVTGIGASFVNKDFLKMLWYIKDKKIYSELYDTFFHIDENVSRELIKMGYDRLIMSIDGATKETYEKIRAASDFDMVTNNLRNLVRLKKEMNAHYPEITFHYIISKDNIHEVLKFIGLAKEMTGTENISILYSAILHSYDQINDMVVDVPEDLMLKAQENGNRLGIKVAWNRNIGEKENISRCTEWTMPFIFVDGTVVPCCVGNEANQRNFQRETAMGNIFEKSFNEIWHGENYKKLRDNIHKGNVPPACANCVVYDIGKKKTKQSNQICYL